MKAIAVALIAVFSGVVFAQQVPEQAPKGAKAQVTATSNAELAKLVKAQTEVIKALSEKVTALEERVQKLETKK